MKKVAPVIIVVVLLFCSIAMIQKSKTAQYKSPIEIDIEQNFTLPGQSMSSGNSVSMNTYVEKAVISSEELHIFQNFHMPEDIIFHGVKSVVLYTKDGTAHDLWRNYKDKSIYHDDQTNEANTHIIFSEKIPMEEMEYLEIAGQKFEINIETDNENI